MVVRCKYGLAPHLVVQMLANRPGNRDAIVSRCPTTNLIEQHKTFSGSRMEDCTRLRHFHHESGLSAHQIVARTNSCEQPVYYPDPSSSCWNKAADLAHQHDQP